MGSLILCHKKKAKQPYEITRIHVHIYTLEELCYYLCNNLYLIDYTIINRQLCNWIGAELELRELSDRLREQLVQNQSMEEFVLTILKESTIYSPSEIHKIQGILERLKDQKEVEREKYKADSLLKSGECEPAILVYHSIIHKEWDETVDEMFYGKVYACLGAAYGRLFLYEEAARMYKEAYRICEEPDMLKAYLYCCYRALPKDKYIKMLSGNPIFLSMDSLLKEDLRQIKKQVDLDAAGERLDAWKKEYRRIDKNTGIC